MSQHLMENDSYQATNPEIQGQLRHGRLEKLFGFIGRSRDISASNTKKTPETKNVQHDSKTEATIVQLPVEKNKTPENAPLFPSERVQVLRTSIFAPDELRTTVSLLMDTKSELQPDSPLHQAYIQTIESVSERFTPDMEKKRQEERKKIIKRSGGRATKARDEAEKNQDACGGKEDLVFVADGVGGLDSGAEASAHIEKMIKEFSSSPNWEIQISPQQAVRELKAFYANLQESFKDVKGSSTLTLARIITWEEKKYAVWLHVGDSRIYLSHKDDMVEQISKDHDVLSAGVENLISSKNLPQEDIDLLKKLDPRLHTVLSEMLDECRFVTVPNGTGSKILDINKEKYREIPRQLKEPRLFSALKSIIVRAVGANHRSEAEIKYRELTNDDVTLLVCSDGISDVLTIEDFDTVLETSRLLSPMDGKLQAEYILTKTEEKFKAIELERGYSKEDDRSVSLLAIHPEREIDAYETFSQPELIHTFTDFKARLGLLSNFEFSIVDTTENGIVTIDGAFLLKRVKMIEDIFMSGNTDGYNAFLSVLKERRAKEILSSSDLVELGDLDDSAIRNIIASYLNKDIRGFPRNFNIRKIALDLFVKKFKETYKRSATV